MVALIGDPIYEYLSKGFRGQPRVRVEGGEFVCAGQSQDIAAAARLWGIH